MPRSSERGRHHGAQLAGRHRRLDLAPLLDGQRAVMQPDRQVLVVDPPQMIEHQLGLGARVDEHDRGLVLANDVVDLGHRVMAHVAAPRQPLLGVDEGHLGRRARLAQNDLDLLVIAQPQVIRQLRWIGDRGGQADEACLRRHGGEPREAERKVMAALGRRKGMQLVDDDAAQAREELLGVGVAQQQRQRFRRRHQQVGRPLALAQAPALRRVAGAALGAHRQLHLGDRQLEVAADVGRQRLQRRDVERVQLALALGMREVLAGLRRRSVSSISDGRNPAKVLPPPVGAISSALLPFGPDRPARAGAPGRPAATFEPA